MRKISFITTSLLSMCILVGGTLSVVEFTFGATVEFPSAIHFLNPAGEDVVVGPGVYDIESTESWLQLVPEGQDRKEAVLLEAIMGEHQESGEQTAVRLEQETGNTDVFHLAVLQPDGTGLEALGTKSGIHPRSLKFSFIKKSFSKSSTRISRFKNSLPRVQTPQLNKGIPKGEKVCGPFQKEIGKIIFNQL